MLIRDQSLLQNKSCTLDLALNAFIDTSVRVVSKDYGDRDQTILRKTLGAFTYQLFHNKFLFKKMN